jgi:hypothetical protein
MAHKPSLPRGILYVALGKESVREAALSARSLHRFHPNTPAQIFTDQTEMPNSWKEQFQFVETLPRESYLVEGKPVLARVLRTRVNCLSRARFRETLHLDADTKILRPLDELWARLSDADFTIANEPLNDWPAHPDVLLEYKNPRYYNAGVFAFRDTVAWQRFLAEWCRRLELIPDHELVHATGGDQRPLNAMIFDEGYHHTIGLRIAELDNLKHNTRGIMFKRLRAEGRWPEVCIAHCHSVHAPWPEIVRLKWLTLLKRIGLSKA